MNYLNKYAASLVNNNLSKELKKGFESIEFSLNSIDSSVQDVGIVTYMGGDSLKDIKKSLYDM